MSAIPDRAHSSATPDAGQKLTRSRLESLLHRSGRRNDPGLSTTSLILANGNDHSENALRAVIKSLRDVVGPYRRVWEEDRGEDYPLFEVD
ncbi:MULTISPECIES: hypothetical protein [unclassified Rhodococcus (in: high G+C Gram-positive bacteria)]|uniref:hypothetical protein n=1 Tax=unclassified Rhodococcus (in: high G+C Gram-positive bacteria) TaxID=192944 RepID=UPI00163B23F6|nr:MULTISPECIES: hypothetical protein [unclassified Rhodococcus (in: high G+C Gram-positive bacteria)]MBC2637746.1 hypothetical protein [Rhodococcus sp. 3A]MBC2897509.1 hypothetical protein [Rhodococcus sp. 4CII]